MNRDKNFDDLASRFEKKIYGTPKGSIRLAVLKKDLEDFFPRAVSLAGTSPLKILDAGGGTGPFSVTQALLGHEITLCDLSEKMLDLAVKRFQEQGAAHNLTCCHCGIQDLDPKTLPAFDMVLCHGVLGWLTNPEAVLAHLISLLRPRGTLSLTFYNLKGMIFKNLLRANYEKILYKTYAGYPGGLTPTTPRTPEQILEWIGALPLTLRCHSGIRVFHDYILDPKAREKAPSTVLDLELEFSRLLPYRDLGRYQHILALRN